MGCAFGTRGKPVFVCSDRKFRAGIVDGLGAPWRLLLRADPMSVSGRRLRRCQNAAQPCPCQHHAITAPPGRRCRRHRPLGRDGSVAHGRAMCRTLRHARGRQGCPHRSWSLRPGPAPAPRTATLAGRSARRRSRKIFPRAPVQRSRKPFAIGLTSAHLPAMRTMKKAAMVKANSPPKISTKISIRVS
jgi:hypothetical protein